MHVKPKAQKKAQYMAVGTTMYAGNSLPGTFYSTLLAVSLLDTSNGHPFSCNSLLFPNDYNRRENEIIIVITSFEISKIFIEIS